MQNELLKILADNPSLCERVRELFEKQFDLESLSLNDEDKKLGEQVRANLTGLQKIKDAFEELETHKTGYEPKPKAQRGY